MNKVSFCTIHRKIGIKRRRLDIFMVAFFVYTFSLQQQTCLSIAGLPLTLKYRIFVLWSVSPVAKLAILFSTIQLHPCPQHQSPWRTLSCFQVYFFLVRLPVAVGLDDEYPLSFLIHCRQHPSS